MRAVVLGTRPEAIKLAPVVQALRAAGESVEIITTGQHAVVKDFLAEFDLTVDTDLGYSSSDLNDQIAISLSRLADKFNRKTPELVIVQGDTSSALVGALAASNLKIPVAHVEAGLRTWDKFAPFPEENYRRMIAVVADYHFAPTQAAVGALEAESIRKNVHLVGNTSIDAVLNVDAPAREFEKPTVLLTLHRREMWSSVEEVLTAVVDFAEECDIDVIFPVHPNPHVQKLVSKIKSKHLFKTEPMGYADFISVMKGCHFVMTDSGGVQEEAPSLNKPVLVLRRVTERSEGIANNALLAYDYATIRRNAGELVRNKILWERLAYASNPYGDGHAAQRIVDVLTSAC